MEDDGIKANTTADPVWAESRPSTLYSSICSVQFGPGSLGERTFKSRSLWWVGPHLPPSPPPYQDEGGEKAGLN